MTRRQHWYVVIVFVAVIYIVPFTQSTIELVRGRPPQVLDVFRQIPNRPGLRVYEKELEEQSIFASTVRPWMQYGRFVLFGDAGEKVLVGRDSWLFYRPDVRYLVEPVTADEQVAVVTAFRDQLRARGIQLMVLPIPGKPSLYGERLTRRLNQGKIISPTATVIARLRKAGVEVLDLFEVFDKHEPKSQKPLYLARDTHWSAAAAEIAASAVAARLEELGWTRQGAADYDVRAVVVPRRSDIARMTRVPMIEASYPPEEVDTRQVYDRMTGAIYRDDSSASVLVLGDSFLRIYQSDEPKAAGFVAHLARRLRQPVSSIVNDGGASTLVRQELARRPQLLHGKSVVIWEFVERDIRFGTEGWKTVTLTPVLSRNP
jgi:lysophospholipase L1-like esterase